MRTEQEVKDLVKELEKLTGFIGENGLPEQVGTKDYLFSCNVCDALTWVLGEIETDHFKSDAYINLERLRDTAGEIETATGKKLKDYR
ncbi:hypothetical protein ES707_10873 [subsurface metagenome]